ncbi:HNH endonuclease [Pseudoalteromonas gelatinilytica]
MIEEYPFTSHSWTLLSENIAIKKADKSLINGFESGVPKDIVIFFIDEKLGLGEQSEPLEFCINSNVFYITLNRKSSGRHYLTFSRAKNEFSEMGISIGDNVWFEKSPTQKNKFYLYTKGYSRNSILPDFKKFAVTEGLGIVNYRLGQSYFRENVIQECQGKCIVTGVKEHSVLVASHIKPWKASNNIEKYDGSNGLLLAPHIDKLFDRGLITFNDKGRIVSSKLLSKSVLELWSIDREKNYFFTDNQMQYMKYHSEEVFKKI